MNLTVAPLDPAMTLTGPSGWQERSILEFWRWAYSNVFINTSRGVLAEFIVASAINARETVRVEWQPFDLTTPEGIRREVKSASYLQDWYQARPSRIIFGVRPTIWWDSATKELVGEPKRHADAYVFCLFAEISRLKVNPLDLNQWEFYVVPKPVLDKHFPDRKTLSLKDVQGMAQSLSVTEIKTEIERKIIREADRNGISDG